MQPKPATHKRKPLVLNKPGDFKIFRVRPDRKTVVKVMWRGQWMESFIIDPETLPIGVCTGDEGCITVREIGKGADKGHFLVLQRQRLSPLPGSDKVRVRVTYVDSGREEPDHVHSGEAAA